MTVSLPSVIVPSSFLMICCCNTAVSLSDAERAQIEDIVKRKTEIGAENIIISTAN